MGNSEALEFLASYWEKAKQLGSEILEELPIVGEPQIAPDTKFFIVKFSELGGNWSVEHHKSRLLGKSRSLEALAHKIHRLILGGNGNSVKPFVEKAIREQKFESKTGGGFEKKVIHFTPQEVNRIKEYFNL